MSPTARRDGLLVQNVGDELIVYDEVRGMAYCLNRPAAIAFRHCDGLTSREELAVLVGDEGSVELALERLQEVGLLEQPVVTASGRARALLVPVIESLLAPEPAAAFSF